MWAALPLILFWFSYFAGLGIFTPYFGLYLRENAQLSGTQVGAVLAVLPLVGIIAQPLWGQIADRTGARSRTLAWLCLGSSLGYLALFWAKGFSSIALTTAVLAFFVSAVIPITVSVSFALLREAGPHAFGFVRVWGTLGFFALVITFPWILDYYQTVFGFPTQSVAGSEPGLEVMFILIAVLVSAAALVGFFLPREGAVSLRAQRNDWKALTRNRAFLRFLIFSFIAYLVSQGPMWLFPILIRDRGGSIETIRTMWILMLVVEVPLVLGTGSGLKRLGARGLLGIGAFVCGIRWMLCAFITDLQLLSIVQVLHGVTVVGLLLGGPLYLDVVAPEKLRSTAQAVLSTVGVGIAGIISNFGSGWLLDHVGINILYGAMGMGSALLGVLVCWFLPLPQRATE